MPARFIVIDGPDGSGTTTQSMLVADCLRSQGQDVVLTAEPSDGPIGVWIRAELQRGVLSADAMQLLFCADRADHIRRVITLALEQGRTVISDRYAASTLVYGEALGLDREWLHLLNKKFIQPDHHFFLLPPLDVCMERLGGRSQSAIYEKRELQAKVHSCYRALAAEEKSIRILDSSGEKQSTMQEIIRLVQG